MRLIPVLLAAVILGDGCKHRPTEKERQGAQIHYDLGIQAQQNNDVQGAFAEYQTALEMDPYNSDAHNAVAILLHLSFSRFDEAIEHYKRALELRPDFSEAKTNLGNVYLDQKRYDDAIRLYEEALNDMLYPTPYIAQGNLGWALFKKGQTPKAIDHIKAAVTVNPKFCLGYKQLGQIYEETGSPDEACRQFTRYREACPDTGDAHYREGVCMKRRGQAEAARKAFELCESKPGTIDRKDECRRLKEELH